MIRELINFMNDLMSDIPDIMEWKSQPDKGLHVFIDIDSNGVWINKDLKKGIDYDYFDGKNKDIRLWKDCIRYQEATTYITMNKVKKFDKEQKIHSCSPFAIAYNFNFSDKDRQSHGIKIFKKKDKPTKDEIKENNQLIRNKRFEVVSDRLNDYYGNCIFVYNLNMSEANDSQTYKYKAEIEGFFSSFKEIISCLKSLEVYEQLSEKDYVHLYLRSVPVEEIEKKHKEYIEQAIFNGEVLSDKKYGVVGFLTAYNNKKPFLKHQTCYLKDGISQRFSINDAMALFYLNKLLKRKSKCLPNPLPIVVDQREINTAIVKIFNDKKEPLSYRQLLESLFASTNKKYLSDYYLLNYLNTKSGMVINDFDFVPMFRYELSQPVAVSNVTISGFLAGLGGYAYLATSSAGTAESTIGGMGFLALAIMIFGNWNPVGIALGSLLFGFLKCIGPLSSQIGFLKALNLPIYFYNILPYFIVIIVLIAFRSKSGCPKAEGIPYDKGKR